MSPPAPRRVAITGVGIVSSIGNSPDEAAAAMRAGRSGVVAAPDHAERGFRSRVKGGIEIDLEARVDRRRLRFMGPGSAYAWIAALEAVADAGLSEADLRSERTGVAAGSGGPSTSNQVEAARALEASGGTRRLGPYLVPRCMSSCVSANLATGLGVRGYGTARRI